MATVIVTPSELIRFAATLRDKVRNMRSKSRKMTELTSAASAVWKDEKFSRLQKDLADSALELERLHRLGDRYADFLEEKANRANKYLDRR